MLVEASNLNKFHGARLALTGVGFGMERGEKTALLGLPRSGKSTLVRLLAGYISPTFGYVKLDGRDPHLPETRSLFGYVPEGAPLPGRMRVREYLRFRARLKGLGRKAIATAVASARERCGLRAAGDEHLSELSLLERFKTSLADALLTDPELFILDEPSLDLHPEEAVEVRELIGAVTENRSLILSGRSLPDAERLCRRGIILEAGKVSVDGRLAKIVENSVGERELVLEIMTRQPVRETLRSIPGVRAVAVLPDCVDERLARVSLIMPAGVDLRREITQACANRGWLITEMRLEPPSLEDVFRRLGKG